MWICAMSLVFLNSFDFCYDRPIPMSLKDWGGLGRYIWGLCFCECFKKSLVWINKLSSFAFFCLNFSSHRLELEKVSPLYTLFITDVMRHSNSEFTQINSWALSLKKGKQTSTEGILLQNNQSLVHRFHLQSIGGLKQPIRCLISSHPYSL